MTWPSACGIRNQDLSAQVRCFHCSVMCLNGSCTVTAARCFCSQHPDYTTLYFTLILYSYMTHCVQEQVVWSGVGTECTCCISSALPHPFLWSTSHPGRTPWWPQTRPFPGRGGTRCLTAWYSGGLSSRTVLQHHSHLTERRFLITAKAYITSVQSNMRE